MGATSDKQFEANRHNALKGGVKTNEGKTIIRFNARTHGILANLVAEYENDFYKNYLDQLFDEFKPETIIENILVERIALHYLKLYRLFKAESEFMESCLYPSGLALCALGEEQTPRIKQQNIQQLADVYSRYEITTENRLYRAIHELRESRQLR